MKHPPAPKQSADSLTTFSPTVDPEQFRTMTFGDSIPSNNGEHCMSTNFDFVSLQTAETEQAAADFTEYQSLLREIAAGKCKRSKAEILAILKDVDRDAAMLQDDVEKRGERDHMIAELDRIAELQAQSDELTQQAKAMREEFEKVEGEYKNKRNPILWKRDRLDQTISEISGYRSKLIETCDDLNLILERSEAEARLDNPAENLLYENQRRLADEIGDLEQALNKLPISMDRADEKRAIKAEIKRLRARYEEGELKKLDFTKQEEKQKAVIREIEDRMARS